MESKTVIRSYGALALVACAVLSCAAVWMGGLNQDEGWYLYAANLVADGKMPYRDFAYTQGPMLPFVYAAFAWVWDFGGLLGARILTLLIGLLGICFAMGLARRLVPVERGDATALVVLFLLATNLYHLYYLAIPKTYALASLFVFMGFYLLTLARERAIVAVVGGACLALAAGTRISLGAILPVVGVFLLVRAIRGEGLAPWAVFAAFCAGGFGGLLFAYGPFLLDAQARAGLFAAQAYHAARGGFDLTWTVGSLSRLVRWYLPVFIILGLGTFREAWMLAASFLAVFAVQMLAPFPYEDYQVPVMGLLAVFAAVNYLGKSADGAADGKTKKFLLVLGLSFAASFGSPLLEKWMTNGQDRFWSVKKEKTELAQLRDVAKMIEAIDPRGKTLLTQDLYLAIETRRRVPKGLEMGPFSVLADAEWRRLLARAECPVAALSAYTFAIEPPVCKERPRGLQIDYWRLVKKNYELVAKEDAFGQNATPLLILQRNDR